MTWPKGRNNTEEAVLDSRSVLQASSAGVLYLIVYSAHSLSQLAFPPNYEDKRTVLLSHLTKEESDSGAVEPRNGVFGQLTLKSNQKQTIIAIGA